MSQASRQTIQAAPALDVVTSLADGLSSVLTKIQERRQHTHTRRVLAELTDTQLADIGLDRQAISPARPTLEVKVGLMSNLMAMR